MPGAPAAGAVSPAGDELAVPCRGAACPTTAVMPTIAATHSFRTGFIAIPLSLVSITAERAVPPRPRHCDLLWRQTARNAPRFVRTAKAYGWIQALRFAIEPPGHRAMNREPAARRARLRKRSRLACAHASPPGKRRRHGKPACDAGEEGAAKTAVWIRTTTGDAGWRSTRRAACVPASGRAKHRIDVRFARSARQAAQMSKDYLQHSWSALPHATALHFVALWRYGAMARCALRPVTWRVFRCPRRRGKAGTPCRPHFPHWPHWPPDRERARIVPWPMPSPARNAARRIAPAVTHAPAAPGPPAVSACTAATLRTSPRHSPGCARPAHPAPPPAPAGAPATSAARPWRRSAGMPRPCRTGPAAAMRGHISRPVACRLIAMDKSLRNARVIVASCLPPDCADKSALAEHRAMRHGMARRSYRVGQGSKPWRPGLHPVALCQGRPLHILTAIACLLD